MKAEELRIGNRIQNGVVVGLTKDTIKVFDGYSTWSSDKMKEPFEPIPLTPEILEKARLIPTHQGSSELSNGTLVIEKFGEYWSLTQGLGVNLSKPFKYVHELQNLHYCVCGSELPINL